MCWSLLEVDAVTAWGSGRDDEKLQRTSGVVAHLMQRPRFDLHGLEGPELLDAVLEADSRRALENEVELTDLAMEVWYLVRLRRHSL